MLNCGENRRGKEKQIEHGFTTEKPEMKLKILGWSSLCFHPYPRVRSDWAF